MPDVNITIKTINDSERGTRSAIGSFTELSSAINLAGQAMQIAKQAYNETIGVTLKYANEVRQLAAISGESTQETGRFIQVLDDFKLTTEDALAATRKLTQNGLAPNIDTLAQLSDQYLALNSVEEQNKFILDNLGKSGLKWVEVLGKGSTAIREQGAAVAESLLPTEQAIQNARTYELALDDWNDSVMALKVSIGNELLPAMTDILNVTDDWARAEELAAEQGKDLWMMGLNETQAFIELAKAERHAAEAANLQTDASGELIPVLEDLSVATNEVSKANTDLMSLMGNLQGETDRYMETAKELTSQQSELWDSFQAGDITADEYKEQLGEIKSAVEENAAAHEDAANRIMFSLIQQEMAVNGLSTTERTQLEKIGVSMGILDKKTVEMAHSYMEQAKGLAGVTAEQTGAMVDSWKDPLAKLTTLNEKIKAAQNLAGSTWTYYFDLQVSGHVPNLPIADRPPGGTGGNSQANQQFATGGSFVVPPQYGIEGFGMGGVATASAGELVTITPKGQQMGGSGFVNNGTINVFANNAEEFMLSVTGGEL